MSSKDAEVRRGSRGAQRERNRYESGKTVSSVGCLEGGAWVCACCVCCDGVVSEARTIWHHEPIASGGRVGADEYRRGLWEAFSKGTGTLLRHRDRIAHGMRVPARTLTRPHIPDARPIRHTRRPPQPNVIPPQSFPPIKKIISFYSLWPLCAFCAPLGLLRIWANKNSGWSWGRPCWCRWRWRGVCTCRCGFRECGRLRLRGRRR